MTRPHPRPSPLLVAAILAAQLLVARGTIFHMLGASTLNTVIVDESVQAGAAVEMSRTGSWQPTWHGNPYYGKPPLKLWVTGRLVGLLGLDTRVLRLPDALAALFTGLLISLVALEAYGPLAALLAPVVLWTCPFYVFLHGARESVQDAPVTLLFTIAVVAWMRAADGNRGAVVVATLAMIAACFVKSVVGLLPAGIAVAIFALRDGPRGVLRPRLAGGLVLVAAVFWWWFGGWSSHSEIPYNVIRRIAKEHQKPWWQYGPWLLEGMGSWFWPFVAGVLLAVTRALRAPRLADSLELRLVLWCLGVLVPFSAAGSKLAWYIYPMYPAAALLATRVLAPPEAWRTGGRTAKALSLTAVVVLGGVMISWAHRETTSVRTSEGVGAFRAVRPEPGTRLHLVGMDRMQLCPDEELHLEMEGFVLVEEPVVADVAAAATAGRGFVLLTDEATLPALAEALGAALERARVARFGGACDLGPEATRRGEMLKTRPDPRVLVVLDRAEILPARFEAYAPVQLLAGFHVAEQHPEVGQMQWMGRRGTARILAGGRHRLAFRVQAFHQERTLHVRLDGREVAEVRTKAWADARTDVLDLPPGGATLELEVEEGCAFVSEVQPGNRDHRCLSIALADLRLVPAE